MAKQIQFRRGTTDEHTNFTGVVGEITIDTTKNVVVVHDGATAGGIPLVAEAANPIGSYSDFETEFNAANS
jgi:hypothetical protein